MSRWCALFFVAMAMLAAAEVPVATGAYDRVIIEPTKTSIYLGTVSLTIPPFVRKGGHYEAPYTAKVFPFFFSSESGQLTVEISSDMLLALERGEAIDFKGRAVNNEGDERHVEGRATPTDARSGKLKVRVFVSRRIQLIFNTRYRFQ